jgi:hypothetical protein
MRLREVPYSMNNNNSTHKYVRMGSGGVLCGYKYEKETVNCFLKRKRKIEKENMKGKWNIEGIRDAKLEKIKAKKSAL